jgi:hypothetical protein
MLDMVACACHPSYAGVSERITVQDSLGKKPEDST